MSRTIIESTEGLEFSLSKTRLTELYFTFNDTYTRRVQKGYRYVALSALKKLFKKATTGRVTVPYSERGSGTVEYFATKSKGVISIGCKNFTGANFRKLRAAINAA